MLSQELLITEDSQDITLLAKEKNKVDQAKMDCEGFQDLKEWCSQPLSDSLQTPMCIDQYGFPYFHGSLESPKIEEDSGCFEEWLKCSTEEAAPAESQISMSFVNQTTNMDHNIKNNIHINYENELDAKPETFVFEDLPAYEETIEVSSSDSMDAMEENIQQFVTVQNAQETSTWSDRRVWSTSEIINDQKLHNYATFALQTNKNDTFSFGTTPAVTFSTTENKDTYFVNTINNNNIENPEIGLSNDDASDCGIALSPLEVKKNNDTIIDTVIIEAPCPSPVEVEIVRHDKLKLKLKMNKRTISSNVLPWAADHVVTTPDVLRTIEQLENDNMYNIVPTLKYNDNLFNTSTSSCFSSVSGQYNTRIPDEQLYELTPPDTPKSNIRKRRRDSDDSDESYIPVSERKTSNKKAKKSDVSIPRKSKGLAKELLDRLNTAAVRGRPPKRRDSVSSSGTYLDDNNSVTSHEDKYRERRDKNNEASRRSRYQRKRKDLETVQAADEMEARNEELRKQAARLEIKTKILREAFLAVLAKK